MKIEFCCERMKADMEGAYAYPSREHPGEMSVYGYWDRGEGEYEWKYRDVDTCPYCGAKIEITVREKP